MPVIKLFEKIRNKKTQEQAKAFERPVQSFLAQLLVKADILISEHATVLLLALE